MFSQSVLGDGGCLFTSLSISLKCKNLLKSPKCINILNQESNKHKEKSLSDMLQDSAQNGFQIRQAVIHWYITNMEEEIKELGSLEVIKESEKEKEEEKEKEKDENLEKEKKDSRTRNFFKAKDVLLLELAKHADVPDSEKKKMLLVLKYLKSMTLFHSWGSTPEYLAFSLLFKYPIKIWRIENNELVLNDQFPTNIVDGDSCINLLFINGNHYEPLITEKERLDLINLYHGTNQDFSKFHALKKNIK